jgi:hypothetical protein
MTLFKRYIAFFSSIGILFLFTQCGPTVQSTKTADVDLEKFDTYAYLPNSDTIDYGMLPEEMVEEKTMTAINDEMQDIGYNINRDDPDLLVKTHIMMDREADAVADPIYSTYNYYYPGFAIGYASPYYYSGYAGVPRVVGYDVDAVQYTEGTMVVDVINTDTNEIVWRGWAEERISPDNFEDEVKDYVEEIFDEFPREDV